MNEDRRDRLRNLTAEAARATGQPSAEADRDAPTAGDLFVLPESADFPVEWLLLDRAPDDPDGWRAVPVDTNPLRGPGDLRIGPDRPGGPLSLRCRFEVGLPARIVCGGRRTGRVTTEDLTHALQTVRDHQQGVLETGPLAEEVAADPEYQDWELGVLRPAREAVVTAPVARHPAQEPAGPETRVWIFVAAALAFLSIGLGTWNVALRQQVDRLSTPVLIGGSQEVVVGSDLRAPAPLRVHPGDQRQLVFIVLSDEAADYERYRVELTDDDGTALWTSADAESPAEPELNLVIPGRFLDGSQAPTHLVVLAVDGDDVLPLAKVPIHIERTEDTTP